MELGLGEIIFIFVVALLVYGGRLPEVAAAVGRSLAELKRGLRDTTDSLRSEFDPLMDLDPRRAVRRAWQPPKLIEAQPGDVRAEVLSRISPSETDSADSPPAKSRAAGESPDQVAVVDAADGHESTVEPGKAPDKTEAHSQDDEPRDPAA